MKWTTTNRPLPWPPTASNKQLKTHRLRTEATLRLNGPQRTVKMREIFHPNYHKLLGIVYLIVDSHHSNLLIDNMRYLACL
jgi:hypothetical protein